MREFDHKDQISDKAPTVLQDVESGDFIEFKYLKSSGKTETRKVIVLEKNVDSKLHGIDLRYISEQEILDLVLTAFGFLPDNVSDTLEGFLPVLDLFIPNPRSFYDSVIVSFGFEQNPYRTFDLRNMSGIQSFVYTTSLTDQIDRVVE
jgi:hypothetical protein